MSSVLIAGCGYVGQRLARRLQADDGAMVHALVSSPVSVEPLQGQYSSIAAIDLDRTVSADTLLPTAAQIYYFIPPPAEGKHDSRLPRFLGLLEQEHLPQRILLISTSGVYGNCNGEWIDETRPVAPAVERAQRRLDAEQQLQRWAREHGVETVILRVAGIYGPGRLPLARLRKGLPMVAETDAPWTNRIHVDDLVTVCHQAMRYAPSGEIYNVSDGHPGNMTDYFNRVADAVGLPRPPLIDLAEADGQLSAGMMSYLRESRRLDNRKMLSIPGVALRYPGLSEGLKASVAAERGG